MIEVEKKFILTTEQENALIKGAKFLGEKKIADIYYDNLNYSLTKKDIWLRKRNGRFELKVPMNDSIETRKSDQYMEYEKEKEILDFFSSKEKNVSSFLEKTGYNSFCEILTTRKKYKKKGFNLDFDIMDFGYRLAEIEYMTDDDLSLKEITEAIIDFAKDHGITPPDFIYGKVVKYLKINSPNHFQALIDAKVIK